MTKKVFSDSSLFDGLLGLPRSSNKTVNYDQLPDDALAIVLKHKGLVYSLGFHISDKVEENIKMLEALRRSAEWTIMDKVHHDRVYSGSDAIDPYKSWPS